LQKEGKLDSNFHVALRNKVGEIKRLLIADYHLSWSNNIAKSLESSYSPRNLCPTAFCSSLQEELGGLTYFGI